MVQLVALRHADLLVRDFRLKHEERDDLRRFYYQSFSPAETQDNRVTSQCDQFSQDVQVHVDFLG